MKSPCCLLIDFTKLVSDFAQLYYEYSECKLDASYTQYCAHKIENADSEIRKEYHISILFWK